MDEVQASVSEFFDADFDYYPARKFPEARPCHGREEFSQFLAKFRDPWSRFEWTIHELIEVGDERVLACLSMRAEGRESGMNLEGDVYQCFWLRNGRFFREEDHLTLSGALRAFGLAGDTLEAAGLRSPSNLDLVRSIYAAWERGEYGTTEWADPGIEIVFADGPSPGSWTGLGGMNEGWRDFIGAWDRYHHDADEYRELEDERVLVLSRFTGRGKRSGVTLAQEGGVLFHFRGGKVTRIARYWDRERALADLGLTE